MISLERLLTSRAAFGLTTASNLQRAICRIADGLPLGDLTADPAVVDSIGDVSSIVGVRPSEMLVLAAVRTAKSLLTAVAAIQASQTCDLTGLGPGEVPRFSIVSLDLDKARVVFRDHLLGNIRARPALHALLLKEPADGADSLLLRHPSGRAVEVKVMAGKRAGGSLVSRWSVGCVFDEAPRMLGQSDAVVNLTDARRSVIGRLRPGAQIWTIGSPWAPMGPVYEMVSEFAGKPSAQLVVVRGTGPRMNPVTYTPEYCERLRLKDPVAYRTDALAEFADPESSLLTQGEIDAVTRASPLEIPYREGHKYSAAMDPATRGNAWALVITTTERRDGREVQVIALARQWVGSSVTPLSPRKVLSEIAPILRGYGLRSVLTDQWSADALRDIGQDFGLGVYPETVTGADNVAAFHDLRTLIADHRLELPPDPVVRGDLLSVRRRVTQSGVAIDLPRTNDGRHADYAAAIARVTSHYVAAPDLPREELPARDSAERFAQREAAEFAAAERRASGGNRIQSKAPAWAVRARSIVG